MTWTIYKAAIEWGVDHKSLAKWLVMLGFDVKPGKKYHTKDISRAIVGDLDFERARLTRAQADMAEMEKARKRGETVTLAEVQAILRDAYLPVRQRLLSLPSEMASRTNPTDPAHARSQLQTWVDSSLAQIRVELPKPDATPLSEETAAQSDTASA